MQHGADIVSCHGLKDILLVGSAEIGLGAAAEYPHNDAVASQEILAQSESIGEPACNFSQSDGVGEWARRHQRGRMRAYLESRAGASNVTVRENLEQ